MSAALRSVQFLSFSALAFCLGACAGSRKGADAGSGASSSGGSSAATGPTAATGGSPTLAASSPAPGATALAPGESSGQGEPCGDLTCPPGKSCIMYYGIAGAVGPKFTACEVKCTPGGKPGCPAGQACVTIADGPGSVCRPSEK